MDRNDYPDDTYLEVVEGMFMAEDEVFNNVRSWDVKQFKFEYKDSRVADYLEVKEDLINQLATDNPPILNPTDEELYYHLMVLEGQLIFDIYYLNVENGKFDFKYSYNEPMHNDYFWHDAYNEYPVVGITWKQAKAFCEWRTMKKNAFQKTKNKDLVPETTPTYRSRMGICSKRGTTRSLISLGRSLH